MSKNMKAKAVIQLEVEYEYDAKMCAEEMEKTEEEFEKSVNNIFMGNGLTFGISDLLDKHLGIGNYQTMNSNCRSRVMKMYADVWRINDGSQYKN